MRRARGLIASAVVAACCTLAAPLAHARQQQVLRPAHADDLVAASAARSAESERLRREADALAAEIAALRADLVVAGKARSRQERLTQVARDRAATLAQEETALADELARQRRALSEILGALQRAARADPPALATRPSDAAAAARAALLLAEAAPALDARAEDLKARIDALRGLREASADARTAVADAEAALAARRAETLALLDRKAALERRVRGDADRAAARAAALAREAGNVRELIDRLERDAAPLAPRAKPQATTPPPALRGSPAPNVAARPAVTAPASGFAHARGALAPPALGQMVRGYREGRGALTEGVAWVVAPGAQIVAPYDGTVMFAAPFPNYGRLLILDVGDGYYIVMVGFGELHARASTSVVAGEPLGEMSQATDGRERELYLEIRKHGQSVNPAPWLREDWT